MFPSGLIAGAKDSVTASSLATILINHFPRFPNGNWSDYQRYDKDRAEVWFNRKKISSEPS